MKTVIGKTAANEPGDGRVRIPRTGGAWQHEIVDTGKMYSNGRYRRSIAGLENHGSRKRGKITMSYLIIHSPEKGRPRSSYDPGFAYLSAANDR
jgi:hypothetical protein